MRLQIDPTDAVPIWKQIEEGVRQLIATGVLGPGDAVASVRELARDLRVNPLTVQKAYRRLADTGILTVRRGEGTFVAPEPPAMDAGERRLKLDAAARRYAGQARLLSVELNAALAAVRAAWKELGKSRRKNLEDRHDDDES